MTSSTTTIEQRLLGHVCKQVQRGLAGFHYPHLIAFGLQIEPQTFGEMQFVFHYQDLSHLATGNRRKKVLPSPAPSLSDQARPPCRLATERTMYNPRPVPFTRDASGPGTR